MIPRSRLFSFEPMLCHGAERLLESDEWRYELKLDGFRAIGRKAGRTPQLWSRNHKNVGGRLPTVVKALTGLPEDSVIDGELVALDDRGRPSFDLLQELKWRANRSHEFVIGGYIPNASMVDSPAGYYADRDLKEAGSVRAALSSEFRRVLLPHFEELQIARCHSSICPSVPKAAGAKG